MNEKYLRDIPIGRENSVSKSDLCELWGASERTVERRIKVLRRDNNDDYQIVGAMENDRRVFYRTNDKSELQDFYDTTVKHGKSIMAPCPKTRRILEDYHNASVRPTSLENNLKGIRESLNLKQTDVVKLMGIPWFDAPLLSKCENGVVKPVPAVENALCAIYGCSKEELFPI